MLRQLPYPFSHYISFASDVDGQEPWRGAAIHKIINQEIGLPLSDSLWVQAGGVKRQTFLKRFEKIIENGLVFLGFKQFNRHPSALFTVSEHLNQSPSNVENHPIYGLLLREWHRGNIDHLHSWQQDYCFQIVNRFDPPVSLNTSKIRFEVPPVNKALKQLVYGHLRIYFSEPPPTDLKIELKDRYENRVSVGQKRINAGRKVQFQSDDVYIVEILFDLVVNTRSVCTGISKKFNLAELKWIELSSSLYDKKSVATITKLERDNFSRLSVLAQLPYLERWNIRPLLLTCHGGLTNAQNFSPSGFLYKTGGKKNSILRDPNVLTKLRSLGDNKSSYAYHADILHRLGVDHIWGYGGSDHLWNEKVPLPEKCYDLFYNLWRTTLLWYDTTTKERFENDLIAQEPILSKINLKKFYYKGKCAGDQGRMIGMLVAAGLALVDEGKPVTHFWYTHFSSGSLFDKIFSIRPLKSSVVESLRKLANYHYNFDGSIEESKRIWVTPAGVLTRYRVVRSQIEKHIQINQEESKVIIVPWRDPVTNRMVPDPNAGTRDLHGITIYVPKAQIAKLFINKRETPFFTRNPQDATGIESVTIVDNNTPTVILDQTHPDSIGVLQVHKAIFKHNQGARKSSLHGGAYASMQVIEKGEVSVSMRPGGLYFWNITHIHFTYRKGSIDTLSEKRMFMEFILEDGQKIAIEEGREGRIPPRDSGSGWWIPNETNKNDWIYHTLPVAGMMWQTSNLSERSKQTRPPLPIGRITEIKIGLSESAVGDWLDIDGFMALRPSANGEASDASKVVAGRVISKAGIPVSGIMVQAVNSEQKIISTKTDLHGYYFFPNIPRHEKLAIAAVIGDARFVPLSGKVIDIRKNEVEIDITISTSKIYSDE